MGGYMKDDRTKAYLATQQLDAFDARTLFDILNVGDGEIGIDHFIAGCMRLKGLAKTVDLVAVLQETRAMHRRMKIMMKNFEDRERTDYGRSPTKSLNRGHTRTSVETAGESKT